MFKTIKNALVMGVASFLVLLILSYVAYSLFQITGIDKTTWLNSLSSLFGAIIGAYIAIQGAIYVQKKSSIEEAEKNNEHSKRMVEAFLIHEIKDNFTSALGRRSTFYSRFKDEDQPEQFSYRPDFIKTDEFDRIKYDLIKYDNDVIRDTIELYSMFEMLKHKSDINGFNQNEFDIVKKIYLKNIEKYC